MLTQKQFVRKCYDRYKALDLTPGDPNDGSWEQAHYPLPRPEGERWIWLLREDHFVQGILQSEEVGRCCFWSGYCKPFLNSHWCENWFEIFDLYEKWSSEQSRQNGLRTAINKVGVHDPANIEAVRRGGRIGSREGKAEGGHIGSREGKSEGGQKSIGNTNSQKWISTADGFISHSGNIVRHNKSIGSKPNARVQLTEAQYQALRHLPQDERLEALASMDGLHQAGWFLLAPLLLGLNRELCGNGVYLPPCSPDRGPAETCIASSRI